MPDSNPQAAEWMRQALQLAERAVALASPNPMVGAVIVREGEVVGTGFHTYEQKTHAEVRAIEAAGERARGATLYVNLEPCSHTGRTGPCTEAILRAGIREVIAAMEDPNPKVAGRGLEQLRRAGVSVEVGLLREEAARLNEAFAKYIQTGLPFVTLKAAMTLDGKIAAREGNFSWVTSEKARAHVQQQRHGSDAVLTGIGTVLADNPLLTDRTRLPRRRPLLRVVMDSALRTPPACRLLEVVENDLLIFCSEKAPAERRAALQQRGACIIPLEGEPLRINDVLQELGRREILSVLLEAGSALNAAALAAGVVDKVFLYYAPTILGGERLPMAADFGPKTMREALRVRQVRHHHFGEDFAVEGYLRDVYRDY